MKKQKLVSLDLHDFSIPNQNLFYIDKLKEQYPDFKVSMFYIPVDATYYNRLMPEMNELSKDMIRKRVNEGWLELIPHGLMHLFGECQRLKYADMELMMDAIDEHFKEFGLPYIKGFCAPNWLISSEAVEALDDHGWWLAIDKNQPDSLKTKEYYEYNWDIVNPFPKDLNVVRGHGHISAPSANDVTINMKHLSQIPPDYKWTFVSELVQNGKAR